MSLTEKYKWKIAALIHNFKLVAENIINEIWSSRQTIVLLKRNPAKMKTCKGYGFKIWTKKHVKGNQEIERDRLKILSKPSDTVEKEYAKNPFPSSIYGSHFQHHYKNWKKENFPASDTLYKA